jgi:hypothetical protein
VVSTERTLSNRALAEWIGNLEAAIGRLSEGDRKLAELRFVEAERRLAALEAAAGLTASEAGK